MTRTKRQTPAAMTPAHPQWRQFIDLLQGPQGCDFKDNPRRGVTWNCNSKSSRPLATRLLKQLGADVKASLAYFDNHGGHCDCEILFNCDR